MYDLTKQDRNNNNPHTKKILLKVANYFAIGYSHTLVPFVDDSIITLKGFSLIKCGNGFNEEKRGFFKICPLRKKWRSINHMICMFLSFYFPVIASNILIVKDCLAFALFSNWETSTLKLQKLAILWCYYQICLLLGWNSNSRVKKSKRGFPFATNRVLSAGSLYLFCLCITQASVIIIFSS